MQEQYYWGKVARGQYINVFMNTEVLPDDVPTVTYWQDGLVEMTTESLPYIKSPNNTFFLRKLIGSEFTNGNYCAIIRYEISAVEFASVGYFQVQGGDGTAPIIAMIELERSLGRAVVTQDEDGEMLIGYRPRKMLP